MRRRTWKVHLWDDKPERTKVLEDVICANCGNEADLPVSSGCLVIAQVGMGFVHDFPPPENWSPNTIECRRCGMMFTNLPVQTEVA